MGKHLYDVTVLAKEDLIKELLTDAEKLSYIVSQKEEEQKKRLGAKPIGKNSTSFSYWAFIANDNAVEKGFKDMQKKYIYQEEYKRAFADVIETMNDLRTLLYQFDFPS